MGKHKRKRNFYRMKALLILAIVIGAAMSQAMQPTLHCEKCSDGVVRVKSGASRRLQAMAPAFCPQHFVYKHTCRTTADEKGSRRLQAMQPPCEVDGFICVINTTKAPCK